MKFPSGEFLQCVLANGKDTLFILDKASHVELVVVSNHLEGAADLSLSSLPYPLQSATPC